jgi:hypothetical protein
MNRSRGASLRRRAGPADIDCRATSSSRPATPTPTSTPTPSPSTMQSLPDARSQSFEELYGPPENFLEIEVGLPAAPVP